MNEHLKKLVSDRVILSAFYTLVPTGAVGIFFLFCSQFSEEWHHPIRAVVLREVGVLLFVTAVLTLTWELIGKRSFTDEILSKANMSRDLADAGILVVVPNFRDSRIPWDELFKNSNRLDIWVSYASTWRNTHAQAIEKLLSRKDARVRVVLPNPNDDRVVQELALRYEKSKEVLKGQIEEAITAFQRIGSNGSVEIYLSKTVPLYTFYLFTNKAVVALYNHRKGRIPVPTLVCDEDGFLFKYVEEEFEDLVGNAERYARTVDL
jgi:ribosomal protein S24E